MLLRYDPAKGGFGAFATAFIIGELNTVAGSYDVVRKPDGEIDRVLLRGNRVNRFIACELSQGHSHADAVARAAEWFDVSSVQVINALQGPQTAARGPDELADDHRLSDGAQADHRTVIAYAMALLTERERLAVEMRLRPGGPRTIHEAGKILGVHFSNVSKIVKQAICKMRTAFEAQGICAGDVLA